MNKMNNESTTAPTPNSVPFIFSTITGNDLFPAGAYNDTFVRQTIHARGGFGLATAVVQSDAVVAVAGMVLVGDGAVGLPDAVGGPDGCRGQHAAVGHRGTGALKTESTMSVIT